MIGTADKSVDLLIRVPGLIVIVEATIRQLIRNFVRIADCTDPDCLTRPFQRVKHDSILPPKIAYLIAAAVIRGQP